MSRPQIHANILPVLCIISYVRVYSVSYPFLTYFATFFNFICKSSKSGKSNNSKSAHDVKGSKSSNIHGADSSSDPSRARVTIRRTMIRGRVQIRKEWKDIHTYLMLIRTIRVSMVFVYLVSYILTLRIPLSFYSLLTHLRLLVVCDDMYSMKSKKGKTSKSKKSSSSSTSNHKEKGRTLFAATNSTTCISSVGRGGSVHIGFPYGPRKDLDLDSPFFWLDCYKEANSVWEQVFYDGEVRLFKLILTFEDEKIFSDRFNNAAINREEVEWMVYQSGKRYGNPVTITALWYWCTDSWNGDEYRTYPVKKRGSDFSHENGWWAAGSPYVNGG